MVYLNNFFFGFAMAGMGVSLPGLINMASVSESIKRGLRAGLQYSAGASVTVLFQALLAVVFAGYLAEHEEVVTFLKQAAIFIFLGLGGVFLYQALFPRVAAAKTQSGRSFGIGMGIAAMNVLNIPYYLTFSTFLQAEGIVDLEPPRHWLFVLGAAAGAMALLSAYAYFAQYINRRARYFTRNLNYFLGGLFIFLAILQWVQLYYYT